MQSIVRRSGWKAVVLGAAIVGGCVNTASEHSVRVKLLTGIEMDRITAGSAAAVNQAEADALGAAPQTTAVTSTLADTGGSPLAGAPFLNYANSQLAASAANGPFAHAGGSSQIQVDGGNGGVWMNAAATGTAIGSATSHAEVDMNFTGVSTSRTDLVYGSVNAVACCNPTDKTEANLDSGAGGPYTLRLQNASASSIPGQTQSRIDAVEVSSTLPLLDAGQALTITAPRVWQNLSQ
ncbi:MAG TPA: hypothetical protein VJ770_21785 [Stellaceae bacterium]|nr:hypothetical protein [Stellaceae bacterium]